MLSIIAFIIVLVNIGSLKTEPIEYIRKNNRLDIPFHDDKAKDLTLLSPHAEDINEHEWNNIDFKYQPNNYRKIVNLNDNEEYKNEEIGMCNKYYFIIRFFLYYKIINLFISH
jgi:hypothetical protein